MSKDILDERRSKNTLFTDWLTNVHISIYLVENLLLQLISFAMYCQNYILRCIYMVGIYCLHSYMRDIVSKKCV